MELIQKQTQQLRQQQLQSVRLLQMSALELRDYLQTLSEENPVVDLAESIREEPDPAEMVSPQLQWLEENDRQNHFYQTVQEEVWDPVARVGVSGGLEETLIRFLDRQLDRLQLEDGERQLVQYLAACLDRDGYFRLSLKDLSEELGLPLSALEQGLEILRSLEPAGVGAAELPQCLELQLHRSGIAGPVLEIVRHHLEDLAKCRYRKIAGELSISVEEVLSAKSVIQSLEPRPGAIFDAPDRVPYLIPDVFVERRDGDFQVRVRGGERPPFRINAYYQNLLTQETQPEVRTYLREKIRHAQDVLWAVQQRGSTLQRCAEAILQRQRAFFESGPSALRPLRMADVAAELGVHESTVSRAVREKLLQCQWGVYPMGYFFSRCAASAGGEETGTSARELLRQLIASEDREHPLSDQKLSEELARRGCPLSRRTVAKYREELGIAGAAGRRGS